MTIAIEEGVIPQDETPTLETLTGDFDPAYPGSTEDAPYGYKEDGTPYKRRPRGSGGSSAPKGRGNMPASNSQAQQAAALLGRANGLLSIALTFAGLPETSGKIMEHNPSFEQLAYEALLTDPQLCRKILGAGTTSGKAGLAMAYVMLGGSVFATAKVEIGEARAARAAEQESEEY